MPDISSQGESVAVEPLLALDLRAREALILGKPPRIVPLPPAECTAAAYESVASLDRAVSIPLTGQMPEFVATMLRHPALYWKYVALAVQLFEGALLARDRELAVLRTGWLCQAPYEWGEHVSIAKRVAKLTPEDIERVTRGSAAPGWDEHDRAILRATEELVATAMISEETWEVLSQRLDEQQLIELPILVGHYQGIAFVQNALRIRLLPGNPGLSAR